MLFIYFFLIFTLFYFTILYWFQHTLTWIHHGCTCDPNMNLPPHNIPLGHPHAPAPSMLYPASDIDWRFDSYMTVYMFQCHSPKSSHPLLLPLSPKVHYTHLSLFCCLDYRVIIAIFLNSVYMCYNAILSNYPALTFSHRVQKTVLYICVSFDVSHIGLSLPSFGKFWITWSVYSRTIWWSI